MPSTKPTANRMTWSAARKKIDATNTMTNTMMVVTVVSLRVGQVTFAPSARTSCKNLNGLIFGMLAPKHQIGIPRPSLRTRPIGGSCLGNKFAAEVRYRAAGDAGYLLPAGRTV